MEKMEKIVVIVERRYISVMPRSEFDAVYDRGVSFPGYFCQACQAWHDYNGWDGQPGPSHCLSEAELQQLEELVAGRTAHTLDTSRAIPRHVLSTAR